jgi:hypothetical protein
MARRIKRSDLVAVVLGAILAVGTAAFSEPAEAEAQVQPVQGQVSTAETRHPS